MTYATNTPINAAMTKRMPLWLRLVWCARGHLLMTRWCLFGRSVFWRGGCGCGCKRSGKPQAWTRRQPVYATRGFQRRLICWASPTSVPSCFHSSSTWKARRLTSNTTKSPAQCAPESRIQAWRDFSALFQRRCQISAATASGNSSQRHGMGMAPATTCHKNQAAAKPMGNATIQTKAISIFMNKRLAHGGAI